MGIIEPEGHGRIKIQDKSQERGQAQVGDFRPVKQHFSGHCVHKKKTQKVRIQRSTETIFGLLDIMVFLQKDGLAEPNSGAPRRCRQDYSLRYHICARLWGALQGAIYRAAGWLQQSTTTMSLREITRLWPWPWPWRNASGAGPGPKAQPYAGVGIWG